MALRPFGVDLRLIAECLDECVHEMVAERSAIRLALLLLVGDRDIVLGLTGRRDAVIQGGAQGDTWRFGVYDGSPSAVAVAAEVSVDEKSVHRHEHEGLAISTGRRNWPTSNLTISPDEAPSVLRMPISLIRREVLNEARSHNPTQPIGVARRAPMPERRTARSSAL
jgi:hypothetical protein